MSPARNRYRKLPRWTEPGYSFCQVLAVYPADLPGPRLVTAGGEEIRRGDRIPEPYGHGTVIYKGPTCHHTDDEHRNRRSDPLPGNVVIVSYDDPPTDWAYRPEDFGAQFVDWPARTCPVV